MSKELASNSIGPYIFSLGIREHLGISLFSGVNRTSSLTPLGTKLLGAYASHKFSMLRGSGVIYETSYLSNVCLETDSKLVNFVIITFEATFEPSYQNVIYFDSRDIKEEKEYRRFIDENHPRLITVLGQRGSMDLANLNVHSRVMEIRCQDYRLIIDIKNETYSVQFKKFVEEFECFIPETLTREILYVSHEGPVFREPRLIISKDKGTIIGLASFLDCKDFAIKSIYMKEKAITLYQRICPDNFSKSYPFVLEYELLYNQMDGICSYCMIGSQLNASVNKRDRNTNYFMLNNEIDSSSKPLHDSTFQLTDMSASSEFLHDIKTKCDYIYRKFDGIPATLLFHRYHFVVRNSISSASFEHSLPEHIYYILKDYNFLVEQDLYISRYNDNRKANPMIIIDIETQKYKAKQRMDMIQSLRKKLAIYLYDYFIFFQGEDCEGISLGDGVMFDTRALKTGCIYEVRLSINTKTEIEQILKPRPDKIKPNSCKMVDLIWKIQQK